MQMNSQNCTTEEKARFGEEFGMRSSTKATPDLRETTNWTTETRCTNLDPCRWQQRSWSGAKARKTKILHYFTEKRPRNCEKPWTWSPAD